jgi:hypothetical protein
MAQDRQKIALGRPVPNSQILKTRQPDDLPVEQA